MAFPAWPKPCEATVVDVDDLLFKEELWLQDASEFLKHSPTWPTAPTAVHTVPSGKASERRKESVAFLSWQKTQLTEHLRRKSAQALVAAQELRELLGAVEHNAQSVQSEEEALCRAEEELLVSKRRTLRSLRQLFSALDLRERRVESQASQALQAPQGREVKELSREVADQATELREETQELVELQQELETREAALHGSEAAFACLVQEQMDLEELREGVAQHLLSALPHAKEAIYTALDLEPGDSESSPKTSRMWEVGGGHLALDPERPEDIFDDSNDVEDSGQEEVFYEEELEEELVEDDVEVEPDEELRPQRLDDLLGTVDSSPGTALPSESRFIGVPASKASLQSPPPTTQVTRCSFPLRTPKSPFVSNVVSRAPVTVLNAPVAKFPVAYAPRPWPAYTQVIVQPKR